MTLANVARSTSYNTTGVSLGPFTIPYQFFEIEVYLDGVLVDPSEYTISWDSEEQGLAGSITFIEDHEPTGALEIIGVTSQTQQADYIAGGAFPAAAHEKSLDRLMMIAQELQTQLDEMVMGMIGTGTASEIRAELGLGSMAVQNADNVAISGGFIDPISYIVVTGFATVGGLAVYTANGGLEIGPPGTANSPYIDFHSSGLSNDYDVRVQASSGTGDDGNGTLTVSAQNFAVASLADTSIRATTATDRWVYYYLRSGSGHAYEIGTQDTYQDNKLLFRINGTEFMQLGVSGGLTIPENSQLTLTPNGGTTIEHVDAGTGVHPVIWDLVDGHYVLLRKVWADGLPETAHILRLGGSFDGDDGVTVQTTTGYGLSVGGNLGENDPYAGNWVCLGPSALAFDVIPPGGHAADPFVGITETGIMTAVIECHAGYSNYEMGMWGFDITMRGTNHATETDAYLCGYTQVSSKHSPDRTVTPFHYGAYFMALCTNPEGGIRLGSEPTHSYPFNAGIVLQGYSGEVNVIVDGHQSGAEIAWDYGIKVGGIGGAPWMNQQNSKYLTAFYALDHTGPAIHLADRHPDDTGSAIYVEKVAGGVGLWTSPDNTGNMPLIAGSSQNSELIVRVANLHAGSGVLAQFSALSDAGNTLVGTASIAAGDYGVLHTDASQFIYRNADAAAPFLWQTNSVERMRLIYGGGAGDVKLLISAATGANPRIALKSGSGIEWSLLTQDDAVGNRLLVRADSTNVFHVATDGIYLPTDGQKIDFGGGQHTITFDDDGDYNELEFRGSIDTGLPKWSFHRDITAAVTVHAGRMIDISQYYDCDWEDTTGGGRLVELNHLVGYNTMAAGSPGSLSVSTLVQRIQAPDTGVSEPFGQIMLVQANRTATEAYDALYWGTDWTVNGPVGADASVRERYLSGINMTVSKYAPGNDIDATHSGSIVAHFSATTFGGANAPDRVGFGLTAHPLRWGVAITGYSGDVDTVTGGHHASATSGMEIGLQIGGRAGSWMSGRDSKIDTLIYLLDHVDYAIDIGSRHPDDTGEAIRVRIGGGSVGIWADPQPGDTQPLTVGKAYAGEQVIYLTNTDTGATSLAKYQAVSDSAVAFLLAASAAAGDYVSVGSTNASGGFIVDVGGANPFVVKINGTDEIIVTSSAFSPFSNDGSALGTTSLGWADLFGASGFTLNIASGNWVATHSSGVLNVSTGDIQIGGSSVVTASELTSALASYQPLDGDLTAIAALTTTAYGRSLLELADETALEALLDTLPNLTSIQGHTVTLTGAFVRSGAHSLTVTTTNTTSVTLPTSGTLAALGNANTWGALQTFSAAVSVEGSDSFVRLTDTDTGADNSIHANNSTGSLSYFADFNNEVANSAHDWYIDNTGATLRMRLDNTGLGIGKTPSSLLHLYSGTIGAATTREVIRLGAGFGGSDAKQSIAFYAANDGTLFAEIVQGLSASGNGSTFSFHTKSDAGACAEKMLLDEDGDLTITGGVSAANLTAGSYTPTITNVANVTGTMTPSAFRYQRVGNQVHVTGILSGFSCSVADTLTRARISLPIASNLGASTDASGVASHAQSVTTGYAIADAANNEVEVNFFGRASTTAIAVTFIYEVI